MEKNNKETLLKIILIVVVIVLFVVSIFFLFRRNRNNYFIVNNYNYEIKIGETQKIDYIVNDDSVRIEWASDNSDIVTIDSNGSIYGINYGSAIITGKFIKDNEINTQNIFVKVYSGDKNIELEKIVVLDGAILMSVNSQFDLPFEIVPDNAYIKSLKYKISDDSIINVVDNKIISKKVGMSTIKATVNNLSSDSIAVYVVDENIENRIVKEIESASFDNESIKMKVGEKKKISYSITPIDAYIYETKWESTNPNVISVNEGEIIAKKSGIATINLLINKNILISLNIEVLVDSTSISVDYYPKKTLKIGESSKIISSVLPQNASDKTITYKSSNPYVVQVNDGVITGKSAGNATITLSTNNNSVSMNINVLPKSGVINGTGNLWGYHSLNEKIPVRANLTFFQRLAQSGKGLLSGNTYTYNSSGANYSYDIAKSLLTANGRKVLVRFYYPENTSLESLNMFAFMGGDGEKNFSSFFDSIEKDKSLIKSAGTVLLIAEGNNTSFDQESAVAAIKFAKIIFNQNQSAKVSIGGFSTGGTKVMGAANLGNYDRVIVFSSYYNWAASADKLKNKEIIFYIPYGDHLYLQAKSTLNDMKKAGYTNVTIISNSSELARLFGNNFLVINPGTLMINRHASDNIIRSCMFSYANE